MAHITNTSARRHFEIIDTVRAGISLLGTEVKSIRTGKGSLVGAQALIRGGEIYLVGATIPPFQEKNTPSSYDPTRSRRLLLTRKEIQRLYTQTESKHLTLVPLSIYTNGRVLKIDIGIARKKNARDKREDIKRRESERSIRRDLKG